MNTSHIKALSNKERSRHHERKRRDNKGRILHTGESQRTDGKYLYKYVDAFGNTKYVYAWRLTPTDPTPKGKREKPSLRELEQQIRRDIEDGIDSTGKKMTLCQLYAKQNTQRANVKKSTQKQREQLMRLLKEDKLGARSIDTIKPSDAKEWALCMKEKGFSYNTINNYKRSLKASFYIAIQDDYVRKNPFDFKLSEVLENDTKEKVALTEEQEQALLSFIKTDNVYHKYYDDVLILLKTGLRISELCGLTIMDVDFIHEVVVIDHQLLKSKEQGYYIETPKTKSGTRQVPLSKETIQAFQRVMKKRPKSEPFVIDGRGNFLFVNHKGKPKVAIDYSTLFVRMVKKYNKHHENNPLPHITPHTLRHTFCTRLASKNMNPKDLQYIMGHSNISITMNWYAHASIDTAKSEVQRLIA
ncbi:MAG: tyrosine-type recombinase/integrase [[Clostridium] scindens]